MYCSLHLCEPRLALEVEGVDGNRCVRLQGISNCLADHKSSPPDLRRATWYLRAADDLDKMIQLQLKGVPSGPEIFFLVPRLGSSV